MVGHLAESSLYREGVLTGGHTAVWGSFFDSASSRWGYGCCRATDRALRCPLAPEAAVEPLEEGEDDDADAEAVRREWRSARLLDDEPPAEIGERSACRSDDEYLARFVLFWFHAWRATAGAGAASQGDRAVRQSREAMLPLLQRLQRGAVPKDLLRSLADFAELASRGEYAQADDVYVGMTIGKALWHSDLDLGEQRAHWGGGCSLRTMQRQVVEKDHKNASLFDTDPVVQRYVHGMKRLVTHIQAVRPAEDPSKRGHAPAPAAAASEVGLPVMRDVRASDGRGHSLPEYAEPDDPRHSGASADRGIAFGARRDHSGQNVPTGRNSHPFAAV